MANSAYAEWKPINDIIGLSHLAPVGLGDYIEKGGLVFPTYCECGLVCSQDGDD